MERNNGSVAGAGLFIAIGLIVSSFIMGKALIDFKSVDRVVTVKGLAEREVNADLVIWPLTFEDADNDLKRLNQRILKKRDAIAEFLKQAQVSQEDLSFPPPQMVDFQSTRYVGDNRHRDMRYQARVTVAVRSQQVDAVRKLMQRTTELVDQGIVIVEEDYQNRSEFLFTGLNEIKPAMIEQATKNAREAAEKFAKDSGSAVGKIKNARQGLFSVTNRDHNSPYRKKVRVVTTVDYYLIDE